MKCETMKLKGLLIRNKYLKFSREEKDGRLLNWELSPCNFNCVKFLSPKYEQGTI